MDNSTKTVSSQLTRISKYGVMGVSFLTALTTTSALGGQIRKEDNILSTWTMPFNPGVAKTVSFSNVYAFPKKKSYRNRYKRIAQTQWFKRTHENMSLGEIIACDE